MKEQDILLIENSSAGVMTLTLNRPRQYNALSLEMLDALNDALQTIAEDVETKVVVIAANGKAFCAGHDLKQMRKSDKRKEHESLFKKCSRVMLNITTLPQPVIAKVQGMATAAGCQLVATCDLAVADSSAQFAVSGIRVGLFCSTPAVALSRNISRKRAMEMLMTGEFIDAQTAMEYGLVNRVTDSEKLDEEVSRLVGQITRHPRRAVQLGKKMFYEQLNQMDLSTAYSGATQAISNNMMLEETIEGIDAFIEKREPNWPY